MAVVTESALFAGTSFFGTSQQATILDGTLGPVLPQPLPRILFSGGACYVRVYRGFYTRLYS